MKTKIISYADYEELYELPHLVFLSNGDIVTLKSGDKEIEYTVSFCELNLADNVYNIYVE